MVMQQRLITGESATDGVVMGTALVTAAQAASGDRTPAGNATRYTLADFRQSVRETQEQLIRFQQRIQERKQQSACR